MLASDDQTAYLNYLALDCKRVYNQSTHQYDLVSTFYQSGFVGAGSVSLGRRENPWFNSYIQNIYSVDSQETIYVRMLDESDPDPTKRVNVEEFIPFHFAFKHGSSAEELYFFVNNTHTKADGYTVLPVDSYLGQASAKWKYIYAVNIFCDNPVQTSSREVKHDIKALESVGEKLDQLQPVQFKYNSDPEERTRHGLIYEDTQPVMPEICVETDKQKAINYVDLIPMLLKEIQDLRSRVAELEAKVSKEDR